MTVKNQWGRPFETLDVLMLRHALLALFPAYAQKSTYSVVSEDGTPMFGRYAPGTEAHTFIAVGWRNA